MSTTYSKTNWGVNGFWTGGYDNECNWYDKVMEALDAPKVPLISTVLGLLFGILVIAVKLRMVEQLLPPLVSPTNPPPEEEFPARPVPPEAGPSAPRADGKDEVDYGITPNPDLPA